MSMTIDSQGNESVAALSHADPKQKLDLYRALSPAADLISPTHENGARRRRSWRAQLGFGWCPRSDTGDIHTVIAVDVLAIES
jgi:hypothetical protein